jgi:hypothetical protein
VKLFVACVALFDNDSCLPSEWESLSHDGTCKRDAVEQDGLVERSLLDSQISLIGQMYICEGVERPAATDSPSITAEADSEWHQTFGSSTVVVSMG